MFVCMILDFKGLVFGKKQKGLGFLMVCEAQSVDLELFIRIILYEWCWSRAVAYFLCSGAPVGSGKEIWPLLWRLCCIFILF